MTAAANPLDATTLKIEAARAALGHVEDGMRLGIGSGSTAEEFVRLLAERVAGGLKITGVPTSERTAALCQKLGVPLSSLDETPELDLDDRRRRRDRPRSRADQGRRRRAAAREDRGGGLRPDDRDRRPFQAGRRRSGASRCRSRSTVSASRRPGSPSARAASGARPFRGARRSRTRDAAPFVTDGGHFIVDASFGRIPDPRALSGALHAIPGVVEHGLFLGMASAAILAGPDGIEKLARAT